MPIRALIFQRTVFNEQFPRSGRLQKINEINWLAKRRYGSRVVPTHVHHSTECLIRVASVSDFGFQLLWVNHFKLLG